MKVKIISNNYGYSLILAIAALAVITGSTAYIVSATKNASISSARARSTSLAEQERSRIAAALSNNETCMLAGNFKDQAPIRSGITDLKAANGTTLIQLGSILPKLPLYEIYYKNLLTVESISTRALLSTDPTWASDNGTDKAYVLQINFLEPDSNERKAYTGKKRSAINIPMYMKVEAGEIVDCYALALNSNINLAIKDACSPTSTPTGNHSLLNNAAGSTEANCEHTVTFGTTTTDTTCASSSTYPNTYTLLSDWTLNNGKLDILPAHCSGLSADCSASRQSAYGFSNSAPQCADAGGSREGCAPGQIIYLTGGSSTCVTVNCTGPYDFVQSLNGGAQTCYTAPSTNCTGTNEYVKVFNENGTDTCGILPTMSGSCAAGSFGTSITRDSGTSNGTLNCTAYTKSKTCATPTNSTFVTAFGPTTSATCKTF